MRLETVGEFSTQAQGSEFKSPAPKQGCMTLSAQNEETETGGSQELDGQPAYPKGSLLV